VRRIVFNAVSIGIVRGAPLASRVFLLLVIARLASPEELAQASFAIAIAEALKMFGDTGIDVWAVSVIGRTTGAAETSRLLSAVAVVKLLFGLIGGLLAAGLVLAFGQGGPVLAVTSGVFVLAGEAFGGPLIYHVSQETPRRLLPLSLVSLLLVPAAGVMALLSGVPSSWACAIVALGECAVAARALASLHASRVLRPFHGLPSASAGVVKSVLPACAYSATLAIYMRLDALVLVGFSATAYATYAVAFRAVQPFSFAVGAVAMAFYSAHVRNRSGSAAALVRTTAIFFGVTAVLAVGVYAVCAWAIGHWVSWYSGSLATLLVLCATLPVFAVNTIGFYVLAGDSRFKMIFAVVALSLLADAALLWLLVPAQGARGAAIALLASTLVSAVFLSCLIFRPRPLAVEERSAA